MVMFVASKVGLLELMSYISGYGHSLLEVKTILQGSLHLCMGIQSNEYHDMVSTCMSNIEVRKMKVQIFEAEKDRWTSLGHLHVSHVSA
jgi:hypothetical protein